MDEEVIRYSIPLSFAEEGLHRLYPDSQITGLAPVMTGFANSIFAFRKDGVSLILRMPPRTTSWFVHEIELMKDLFRKDIRVPQVMECDFTYQNPLRHPFMIMERLQGKTLFEAIEDQGEAPRNLVEDIARSLYQVHRVDPTDLDVKKFSSLQSFLDEGLSNIRRFAKLGNAKNFEAFEEWFQKNRPTEKSFNKSFIHNDFHGYNIIVNGEALSGILDWNDAVVAEAQVDVAMFSLLAEAAGYPELAETFVTAYECESKKPLREIRFYVTALAVQKFIQIPFQKKQMEQTSQNEKAELLGLIATRLEKNFIKIIEENTDLSVENLR